MTSYLLLIESETKGLSEITKVYLVYNDGPSMKTLGIPSLSKNECFICIKQSIIQSNFNDCQGTRKKYFSALIDICLGDK